MNALQSSAHEVFRSRDCIVRDCTRVAENGSDSCWQCGRGQRPHAEVATWPAAPPEQPIYCAGRIKSGEWCLRTPKYGQDYCPQHRGQA